MTENEGFQVTDEIDVVDLTDVKEDRVLIPAVQNLKVRIVKTDKSPRVLSNAKADPKKEADIKSLGLTFEIVDGITVVDKESGEESMKYKGMKIPTGIMDLIVWADTTVGERATKKWWENKQHLVGLKGFCQALEIPLSGLKVTDDFLSELIGRELLVDIVHEKETVVGSDGKRQETGTLRHRIKRYKKVS